MSAIFDNWKILVGIILVVVCVVLLIKTLIDRKKSIKLDGEIIDFVCSPQGMYFPLVKFVYDGEELVMQCGNGARTKKGQVKDKVTVLYDPRNVKYVNIAGNNTDIIMCILVMAYGILMVLSEIY